MSADRPCDLSIIVVSWNVAGLLRTCLESIYKSSRSSGVDVEVIVVDNASSDGTPELVRNQVPDACLIVNNQNVGFTRGNNQGLAKSRGRHVMLLNPDTVVLEDALGRLVRFLDDHPAYGAAGPQLLNIDGTVQSSRRRFPTLPVAFVESTLLQRWLGQTNFVRRYFCEDRSPDERQDVDWLVGAALVVRRTAIDQVGPLDERFFMYSEELDWCKRIRDAGWQIAFLPDAKVVHHEGKSSEQVVALRHIYFHSSRCAYVAKHFGRAAGEVLRWFLLGTYLFQLAEESGKLILGSKRSLRRSRISAYWQVLRSGLR